MAKQKDVLKGAVAGVIGGLVAAWMVNQFISGLKPGVQDAVESEEDTQARAAEPEEDVTRNTADAVAVTFTGEHLPLDQEETGGPAVQYAFGALSGGVYGALAEVSPLVRSGFGSGFGSVVFRAADLLAVPAFGLGPASGNQASAQTTPFAAHIVYGATTELVRRIVRFLL